MARKKSALSKAQTRREAYKRKQQARSYASRSWRVLLLTVRAVQKFSSFIQKWSSHVFIKKVGHI